MTLSPGNYTFFYQVTDQEGKVAVGPLVVEVPVKAPTLSIEDSVINIDEAKDGTYLEIDIGQYISEIDLSGSKLANLSFKFKGLINQIYIL